MYDKIPEWLRQPKTKIYCTHKNKVPNIKVNDLNNFVSFDDALSSLKDGEGLGIGLWGYLCGIDVDNTRDLAFITTLFPEAYIEYSLSMTGVHILFLCKCQYKDPSLYYTKLSKKHTKDRGYPCDGLEFYQGLYDHRFFTLTGNAIQSPDEMEFVSGERLLDFLETYFKRPPAPSTSIPLTHDDAEDLAWWKWARQRRPEPLFSLAQQTPTGSGGTESEDDLALMAQIAFWTNKNPALMKQAFESSKYYSLKDSKHKRKWARLDYQNSTIKRAQSQGSTAKEFFENSYMYDPDLDTIIQIKQERSDDMIATKHTTRVSQKGDTIHVLETKRFKFEVSHPKDKKDSSERYVQWVSVYEKGSDNPSSFLNRKDPAFELAAGIVLKEEE